MGCTGRTSPAGKAVGVAWPGPPQAAISSIAAIESAMPVRYWLFVLLTLLLTGFIGYTTFATARLLRTWRPERNPLLLPAENVVRLCLIALCSGLGLLSGLERSTLGWVVSRPILQVSLGIGLGTLLAGIFYVATRQLLVRTGDRFYSPLILDLIVPDSPREFRLILLAMAPVVLLEELLFRSLLVGGLSPLVETWLLVAAVGILFGLMHSPQGLWGMAGAGVAGICFGAIFVASGSLLLPLVAHYVANILQIGQAMRLRRTGRLYTAGKPLPMDSSSDSGAS